jgi:hypothetical protein
MTSLQLKYRENARVDSTTARPLGERGRNIVATRMHSAKHNKFDRYRQLLFFRRIFIERNRKLDRVAIVSMVITREGLVFYNDLQ